ncbi:MAG: PBS lyase [Desulfuromonas sp.]|nr:MAG: PBS lyase [Desulfuromonas sp.]
MTSLTHETMQEIMTRLCQGEEEERLQALRTFGVEGAEASSSILYQALGDESWRVRKEATEIFLALPAAGSLAGEIIELLHSQENAGLRNAAAEILVRLGGEAVPFLCDEANCSDHDVRKFVLDILGDIGDSATVPVLVAALNDCDENVRASAAENLGKLKASEAIPALFEALATPDLLLRFTILEALGQIGEEVSVVPLLPLANETLLRKALFDCLGKIGDAEAVPLLGEGVKDGARNVRTAALMALYRLSGKFPEMVKSTLCRGGAESLFEALDSHDNAVRRAAIELSGLCGDGRLAVALLPLFDVEELRESAAAAVIRLGHAAAEPLRGLWPAAPPRQRAYLTYLFGEVGYEGVDDYLCDALAAEDADQRQMAAHALGQRGNPAAVSRLLAALEDESNDVREMACVALGRIGTRNPSDMIAAVTPLLEREEESLRTFAARILGELDHGDVERLLSLALKDVSALVRRAAIRAFDGRGGEERVGTLALALTDEDSDVRRLCCESLGSCGSQKAVEALSSALKDDDIWVRVAAIRALGQLGGSRAMELIETALNEPVGIVAITALETLATLEGEAAFTAMLAALRHVDEEVVNVAVRLLSETGRNDWLESWQETLLNHRHWEVRCSFARALAAFQPVVARKLLEARLLVEGEELVRQQLTDLLADLDA